MTKRRKPKFIVVREVVWKGILLILIQKAGKERKKYEK
jgi:hypothetical protein